MAYKLILQPRPAYLHAGLQGARLPTSDVFAIVMEESSRARGVFQSIAYARRWLGEEAAKEQR